MKSWSPPVSIPLCVEAIVIGSRHWSFMRKPSGSVAGKLPGSQGSVVEQRNVNDALEYSISTAGEARSATRMVGALYRFWLAGGLLVQARYWTDRALNAEDRELDPFRVDVLAIDAVNHAMQGELERAEELVDESWRLANDLAGCALARLGGVGRRIRRYLQR